ncbi:MAG: hypothetical protein ACYC9O_17600, partial [Candidatus Latescibacterota bacterium]
PDRPLLRASTFTSYTSFDYNGWRPNQGVAANFLWKSPAPGLLIDPHIDKNGKAGQYASLAEFSRATGQEKHGVIVDYDIFESLGKPDPERPWLVYAAESLDFRLKPGTAAVDAGCEIPNVNDNYTGKRPDIGACETGVPLPVYGPRVTKASTSGRK